MKKIVLIIMIFMLALFITGCGTPIPLRINNVSSQNFNSDEDYSYLQNKIFKLKEPIKIGGLQFTINSLRTSKGSDFIKPRVGYLYLYIDTTVKNIDNNEASVSSILTFKLVDMDGRSYDLAFVDNSRGNVDGSIGSGVKITGELVYEIPDTIKNFQLEIDPYFGKGVAIASVEVK